MAAVAANVKLTESYVMTGRLEIHQEMDLFFFLSPWCACTAYDGEYIVVMNIYYYLGVNGNKCEWIE